MKIIVQHFLLFGILFCFGNSLRSEPIDSTVWSLLKNKKSPIEFLCSNSDQYWENPSKECGIGDVGNNWTFPLCVGMKLTAFKGELLIYCKNIQPANPEDINRGLSLFAGYSASFGGNWDEHWQSTIADSMVMTQIMDQLKKSSVRRAVWDFIQPALKYQIKSMELKYQGIVVISFEYVSSYFKNYNVKKASEWYDQDKISKEFASKDYRGNSHPSRKITALIERLMFKWQIVDYKTVTAWIDIIGNWLKKTLGNNYAKSKIFWGK
jgi:hypothetical protein